MPRRTYFMIDNEQELRDLFKEIKAKPLEPVALDTETFGPLKEWTKARIVDEATAGMAGTSLTFQGHDFYIPVNHVDSKCISEDTARRFLAALFSLPNRFAVHNALYDLRVFKNIMGVYPKPARIADTMVLAAIAGQGVPFYSDGEESFKYDLKTLMLYHFDEAMADYDETIGGERVQTGGLSDEQKSADETAFITSLAVNRFGSMDKFMSLPFPPNPSENKIKAVTKIINKKASKRTDPRLLGQLVHLTNTELAAVSSFISTLLGKQQWRTKQFNEITSAQAAPYASHDTRATMLLFKKFWPMVEYMRYADAHDEMEVPFLYLLRSMQDNGFRVDPEVVKTYAKTLAPRMNELANEWQKLTGVPITSAKQSTDAVFFKLKAWPTEGAPRTRSGALSISKHTLSWAFLNSEEGSLGRTLAIIKKEHSRLFKQYNTYTQSLIAQVPYQADGRVHTEFDPNGAATSRISSRNPNIQNVTRPDDEGDISLCIRDAFTCDDGNALVVGDWSGLEVRVMAHFSKDPLLVRSINEGIDMHTLNAEKFGCKRSIAKAAFFAWFYGAKAKKIGGTLFIPVEDAKRIVDGLDAQFPGVVAFRRKAAEQCRKTGYVETLSGRRRWIPNIMATNVTSRFRAERQACNTIIQGTAADIAKVCGIEMLRAFELAKIPAKMIAQIHDEYIVETKDVDKERVCCIMKHVMSKTVALSVPLDAEVRWGRTWAKAK